MKRLIFAASALLLWGCSSSGAPATPQADGGGTAFPQDALETAASNSGALTIEVRTSPDQPPMHGVIAVELRVADAKTSAPVDGLTLAPVPWMPAHGHGTSTTPTVTPRGQGRYEVDSVNFYMPGSWQLRTDISGPMTDHVDVSFDVR